jgi:hypothetical protein
MLLAIHLDLEVLLALRPVVLRLVVLFLVVLFPVALLPMVLFPVVLFPVVLSPVAPLPVVLPPGALLASRGPSRRPTESLPPCQGPLADNTNTDAEPVRRRAIYQRKRGRDSVDVSDSEPVRQRRRRDSTPDSEPVRQRRRRDSTPDPDSDSDPVNKVAARPKRRKMTDAYSQAMMIERETADEMEATKKTKKKMKERASKALEDLRRRAD